MKIVFITTSLSVGGAELMLLKLLQKINRSRFDPLVISLRTKDEVGLCIEELGIPVFALNIKPSLPSPLQVLALVKYLRCLEPDLVQTWMYHADLLGGLAARLAGCHRVVWGVRNSNLDAKQTKHSTIMIVKLCAALSSWLPEKILSCSKRAAEVHTAVGYALEKIHVIPNGFDLTRFQPDIAARKSLRLELGLLPDTQLVGFMARFDPQKNHFGFLEAAARIRQNIPGIHFILAGVQIERSNSRLLEAIRAAGVSECMHLLGRRDDMPRLMAALDVLASPSSFGEAFPNVLGEAMACGVPCVVTDVGDSALIVGETGRVVAVGDMVGLANAVCDFLLRPEAENVAIASAARERVAKLFDIQAVVGQYESFYEALLSTGE